MSQLRVYIVIATFHPLIGGAETQAMAQALILRERGHESTIVTFRHEEDWPPEDEIKGVPVKRVAGRLLNGRKRLPRKLQQLAYMLALLDMGWELWKKRDQYDILHVYQLSSLALPTALASYLSGKPLLISVRSTGSKQVGKTLGTARLVAGPLDPQTPWLHIQGVPWVNGDLEGLFRLGKPVAHFTHSLLRRINARIIVLSTRMRSYLAENNFLLPNTQLIPNGVDINRFQPPDDATFAARAQTVISIGKLRYEKGIDVLLQAWYLVLKECPGAKLIIVGSDSQGTDSVKTKLFRMAEALGLGQSVEFAGLQKDIPAQLHRAAISVLPSRWEGMPNAVLEAMACGLPCVSTRVSGSEDIIQHGVNGFLVDVEDYKSMAQALLTLLQNPDLTRQYGQAARTTVEQHFSFADITDTYMELYHSLIGQKKQEKFEAQGMTGSPSEHSTSSHAPSFSLSDETKTVL